MASSSDLAGALEAIEALLKANWTVTPIVFDNCDPGVVIPPLDDNNIPQPWVFCEVIDVAAKIVGFGTPGNQTNCEEGLIILHVLVQKGQGLDDARAKAVALGEIFRQRQFYNSDPTAYVRTTTPRVGRGSMVSEDGNQVSMTCTIPYEFYHQA